MNFLKLKPKDPMVGQPIRLTSTQRVLLRKTAHKYGLTMSEIVRQLIDKYLRDD